MKQGMLSVLRSQRFSNAVIGVSLLSFCFGVCAYEAILVAVSNAAARHVLDHVSQAREV